MHASLQILLFCWVGTVILPHDGVLRNTRKKFYEYNIFRNGFYELWFFEIHFLGININKYFIESRINLFEYLFPLFPLICVASLKLVFSAGRWTLNLCVLMCLSTWYRTLIHEINCNEMVLRMFYYWLFIDMVKTVLWRNVMFTTLVNISVETNIVPWNFRSSLM